MSQRGENVDWRDTSGAGWDRRDTRLTGFPCSFKYFAAQPVKAAVQHALRFRSNITRPAAAYLRRVLHGDKVFTVGIHVRRGDMMGDTSLLFPPPAYFRQSMQRFRKQKGRVQFIVASDDTQWCSAQPYFQDKDVHIVFERSHGAMVDLAILSRCDGVILSRGTFGHWAALLSWMSGGEVTYFGREFNRTDAALDPA